MTGKLIGWLFGLFVLALGITNIIYGNDSDFGFFLVLLSFIFYPPIGKFLKSHFGFLIPIWVKIVLALFILWSNIAVGAIAEGYVF